MAELTNRLRRLVADLDTARVRRQEGLFVAEGTKCVLDMIPHFKVCHLFATQKWVDTHYDDIREHDVTVVKKLDIERMSHLTTPSDVIAVMDIAECPLDSVNPHSELVLALDRVQDPGNLGTIIRIADWFGIRHIVCSPDTADTFNPKVVQATMGALSRVKVCYTLLPDWLSKCGAPTYGTFLDGESLYESRLSPTGVIIMGNEGRGISDEVAKNVAHRITIPSYPTGESTSESLNVGMATAITVAEFRRRQINE